MCVHLYCLPCHLGEVWNKMWFIWWLVKIVEVKALFSDCNVQFSTPLSNLVYKEVDANYCVVIICGPLISLLCQNWYVYHARLGGDILLSFFIQMVHDWFGFLVFGIVNQKNSWQRSFVVFFNQWVWHLLVIWSKNGIMSNSSPIFLGKVCAW